MIPFVGGSHELRRKKADTQRSVNLFPAEIESGSGKSRVFLKSVPGLRIFSVIPVLPPAFEIVKTQADDTIDVGDEQTYTIVAENTGFGPADGATITDTLPESLTFTSCTIDYSDATGPASATADELAAGIVITTWAAGGTVTLTITGTFADAGEFDNLAEVVLDEVFAVSTTVTTTVEVPPDPCLKFLMHFDGNLTEEILGETITTTGTFSYPAAKFSSGFGWLGNRVAANPTQAWHYDGDPIVPSPLVTGWTLEFWTTVLPNRGVSGGGGGPLDWLIIDGADSSAFWVNFGNANHYRIGQTGGSLLGAIATGALQHLVFQYDPAQSELLVRFFVDGALAANINAAGVAERTFHTIDVGDMSSYEDYTTYGYVDEFAVWACPRYPLAGFTPPTAPFPPP